MAGARRTGAARQRRAAAGRRRCGSGGAAAGAETAPGRTPEGSGPVNGWPRESRMRHSPAPGVRSDATASVVRATRLPGSARTPFPDTAAPWICLGGRPSGPRPPRPLRRCGRRRPGARAGRRHSTSAAQLSHVNFMTDIDDSARGESAKVFRRVAGGRCPIRWFSCPSLARRRHIRAAS